MSNKDEGVKFEYIANLIKQRDSARWLAIMSFCGFVVMFIIAMLK